MMVLNILTWALGWMVVPITELRSKENTIPCFGCYYIHFRNEAQRRLTNPQVTNLVAVESLGLCP